MEAIKCFSQKCSFNCLTYQFSGLVRTRMCVPVRTCVRAFMLRVNR